jgi:hypothetical protein
MRPSSMPGAPRRRRHLAALGAALLTSATACVALASAGSVSASTSSTSADTSLCPDANVAAFGPDVCVFTPSMSQAAIQADLDAISTQQVPVDSQFDSQRYAVLFEPGTFGSSATPLVFQVGYYTEVAGLGSMPQQTIVNGAIEVFNNLCTAGTSNCNSDDNFWRSLSNLDLNVDLPSSPPDYAPPVVDPFTKFCTNSAEMWSASQASPIRRAIVNGSVVFQDYCANKNFASGGFIADSQFSGNLNFFGNQQFMVRNSAIGGVNGCGADNGGLWNMVYSGVQGAPPAEFGGLCDQNTVLPTSTVSAEAPFLYDNGGGDYQVFVPAVQHNSSGPSWASGSEAGSSIPLSQFFIANPDTPVVSINAALASGKNLILTPGVYNLDHPIRVVRQDTVVLGLGFATLVPQSGNAALIVVPSGGVKVSGLIVDAGPVNSPVLMSVGVPGPGSARDPDTIQDVFFRIGGAETTNVSANVSLLDNASNSIIDDVWAWRADHGNAVGWTQNVGDTGLVVTGDNVTADGLFVEHYQKNEVIWSGQGGTDVFFQNELPYDPPSQADWMASPTQDGYPAFLVTPNVTSFRGVGMGSYSVFINTPATLTDEEAFQAPNNPGVQFQNVFALWIAGSGGYNSVINGVGGPVNSTTDGGNSPIDVPSYP